MSDKEYRIAVHIEPAPMPTRIVLTVRAESEDAARSEASRIALETNPHSRVVGVSSLGKSK